MRGLVRRLAAVLGVPALCVMTGCAGFWVYPGTAKSSTGTGSTAGDYVYVANYNSLSISGFAVGSTGALSPTTGSPVSLNVAPTAMVVNPADSLLFVSVNGGIYSYSIGTGGVLTAQTSGYSSGLGDVVSMDVSPDGQWLIALGPVITTSNDVTLYVFAINSSTGALTSQTGVGGQTYNITGSAPIAQALKVASLSLNGNSNGEDVFVALGTAGDLIIPFNTTTGTLASSIGAPISIPSGYPANSSDNALAINPSTSTLYVARSKTTSYNGELDVYSITSSGGYLLQATAKTGVMPSAVALNTAGTNVYVANTTGGTISGFSTTVTAVTGSSGVLPELSGSQYSSGAGVNGLAADKSGDYLLAITKGELPGLSMYSYDSTTSGALDPAASATTGTLPYAIAVTH